MQNPILTLIIILSASAIAVGVFLPLTELPVYGEVNYNSIAEIESYIVILCALSAPVFIFMGMKRLSIFSAVGVWATLLFPTIEHMWHKEQGTMVEKMMAEATGPMAEFAVDFFVNITEFSWGGYVFLVACVIFTLSCLKITFKL